MLYLGSSHHYSVNTYGKIPKCVRDQEISDTRYNESWYKAIDVVLVIPHFVLRRAINIGLSDRSDVLPYT